MGLHNKGSMNLYERAITVLRASPVFGSLDALALHDLAQSLEFENVRGGSVVFRQGEVSESVLFVISGALRVSQRDDAGGLRLYNEVRSGQSIGEVGLILQQPRAADVTAIRDSSLAVLRRSSFEALLLRHPVALNRIFVHAVHDFARYGTQTRHGHYAQSFMVVPLHPGAVASEVASSLAQAFAQRGRVHHFKPQVGATDLAPIMQLALDSERHDELDQQFDFLVYEAENALTSWTRRCFRQADQLIFVAAAGTPAALGQIEEQLTAEPGFAMKRKHLVLLHASAAVKPQGVSPWRGLREFERIYPLRQQHTADFSRLGRFLTGTAVGVVLGGGGARGFAHVGVLRAMHEAGIPVDLVGGNSMGALIGAQYAHGVSLDEILRRTQHFASGGERLTLPLISLVSGRRVERDLKRMFGDVTMDDLWLPYFAAACNLTKGVTTAQDSGLLWRAVLASNSPAGLFPPVLHQGDLLVDGAILDNVPVAAMRSRLGTPLEKRRGNGTIIAIDVDVPQPLCADPAQTRLTLWRTLQSRWSSKGLPAPSIASILYYAGHIGGASQRKQTMAQADHYLMPPVSEFSLMSYRRANDIAEVGYRYAIEQIQQWNHSPTTPQRTSA